jgi:hypothetical protein
MPHPFKVATLPQPIREQLNSRLVENRFGGFDDLSAWLATEGHPVSKSALARYATACRAEIEGAVVAAQESGERYANREQDIRLRVLELAATQPGPDDLISRAERLMNWVRGT